MAERLDGRELTPKLHLNPRSGHWTPDNSRLQRHINAALAYDVWLYHQATNDIEFLALCGAEMFIEIARFWASIATYDSARDRYLIPGVVGPDEYHDAYPGSERPGIDNNAYTNAMAAWVLWRVQDVLGRFPSSVVRSSHTHSCWGAKRSSGGRRSAASSSFPSTMTGS